MNFNEITGLRFVSSRCLVERKARSEEEPGIEATMARRIDNYRLYRRRERRGNEGWKNEELA